jgi:WD40 repeat protein
MAGTNGSVVIYNIDTGQYVTELTRNNSTIYGVSFSPDGNYIAYGGSGNDTVYVHNVSDWSLYGTQSNANQTIRSVAFSKDSQYIGFTSYQESFIAPIDRLFDETTFTETSGNCYDIAFSNNNDYVAYGAQDENVYVHDVSTGNLVTTLSGAFSEVLSVDFSNDGQYIAYGETRRDVTVHNVSDWSEEAKIDVDGDVEDLEFTPDSSYLVAVTDRGTVYIIDTNSWSTVSTIQKATDDISTVSVSSDGLLMAYGSRDQMVRVHNSEKLNIVPEYVKLVHGKNEWAVTDLVEEI